MATRKTTPKAGKRKRVHDTSWGEPFVGVRMPQDLIDAIDGLVDDPTFVVSRPDGSVVPTTRSHVIRWMCRFALLNKDKLVVYRDSLSVGLR